MDHFKKKKKCIYQPISDIENFLLPDIGIGSIAQSSILAIFEAYLFPMLVEIEFV